jgi:hypothetical protein
LFFFAGFCTI